jgi:large subunit ribosomal protein L29
VKLQELRNLDDAALRNQIREYREEIFNLRFQQVVGNLTATARQRVVRREIARLLTILRERELGIAAQE